MTAVAVIPARGGSRRVPRKNIRPFGGRPMLAYPIETARRSGLFERIIVSTDDDETADLARSFGADVPFLRPAHLSDDHTGTIPVVAHATRWALDELTQLDFVCCIYPATPFLDADDLQRAYGKMTEGAWDYCLAACEYASPIFRSFRPREDGGVEMFFPDRFPVRSQDLPRALHDAGQFYFGRVDAWLAERPIFGPWSTCIELPRWRAHDIDTEEDWRLAELVWRALQTEAADDLST